MKDMRAIEDVLKNIDTNLTKYPGMTYEQGVEEALLWVIGEISDDEFVLSE
jgi:hypothetical protein